MNTFFYTSRNASCPADCSYPDCAERCLQVLQAMPALASMDRLPNGSLFPLSPASALRNGDLIIVHIASKKELETLVSAHQELAPYRLVLIMSDEVYDSSQRYHLLNPRYFTTTSQAAVELDPVIRKLTGQPANHRTPRRQAALTTP